MGRNLTFGGRTRLLLLKVLRINLNESLIPLIESWIAFSEIITEYRLNNTII
ncbi:MAG: hypothetical protein ACXADY_14545 [Candidatus Hodarchaeales archaeon]|jgi:hypothetical protein